LRHLLLVPAQGIGGLLGAEAFVLGQKIVEDLFGSLEFGHGEKVFRGIRY
jgi:hypothetical protein